MSGRIGVKAKRPIPMAMDRASMQDSAMRHAARSRVGTPADVPVDVADITTFVFFGGRRETITLHGNG
ncbi:hypothetical protein GCM10027419_19300 [Pandoraea terrae]